MNSPADPEKACLISSARKGCELQENLEVWRAVPVFSDIPLQRLKVYAYLSKRARYRGGEFLFRQGDSDDRGFIIISGKVQVIREFEDHSVLLNELKEGDFFGGLVLLADTKRLFSAKAVTDLELLTFDRESFQKLLIQFPEVALKAVDMMIKRLVEMEERFLQAESYRCLYG